MSTTAIAEKVKIVPLYVHDGATQNEDGSYTGTFNLITKPTYTEDVRVIADVKPYGGNFATYDEAKVYAKLFTGAPDMAKAIEQFIFISENLGSTADRAVAYQNLKKAFTKAIQ